MHSDIPDSVMHLSLNVAPDSELDILTPAFEQKIYDIMLRVNSNRKVLAFCMASHPRLGGMNGCEASGLSQDLLLLISAAVHG